MVDNVKKKKRQNSSNDRCSSSTFANICQCSPRSKRKTNSAKLRHYFIYI